MPILILCVIVVILIFLIAFLGYKELGNLITKMCDCCRDFTGKNTSFFTIVFLLIFFLEQALLIIFIFYFFDVSTKLQILISIFALIVVTTATLQKFVWEYKYQSRSKEVAILGYENNQLISDTEKLIDENQEIINQLKKKR